MHRALQMLTVLVLATICVMMWLAWSQYSTLKEQISIDQHFVETSRLKDKLIYLDEVLTMSARLAVSTGDLKWEQRYFDHVDLLDSAIKQMEALVHHGVASMSVGLVAEANQQLVKLESRVFEHVRASERDAALSILKSDAYSKNKITYMQGLSQLAYGGELHIRLESLKNNIVYLEEAVSSSLSLAASTQSQTWLSRYQTYNRILDEDISTFVKLSNSTPLYASAVALQQQYLKLRVDNKKLEALLLTKQQDEAKQFAFSDLHHSSQDTFRNAITGIEREFVQLKAGNQFVAVPDIATEIFIIVVPALFLFMAWFVLVVAIIKSSRRLDASERWHSLLHENIADGIVVIDKKGLIRLFNPAAEKVFGYREAKVIGKNIEKLLPDVFCEHQQEGADSFRFSEHSQFMGANRELQGLRADGSEFDLEMSLSSIKTNDEALIVVLVRDITQRKQSERYRELREHALEVSNNELEQFAYVASHDLQEPLRMVASYLELLMKQHSDKLDAQALKWMSYAIDGSTRMKVLVNDLLEYSRVSTNGGDLKPVELKNVIELCLCDLHAMIEEAGAVVTHEEMPVVLADESQLRQLLQNLVGNAIKYRSDECLPQIRISVQKQQGEWCVAIRDNGIGIEQRFHKKIFTIFQRLHGRGEYAGTGIGLAICQRIVERHNGTIWLESVPGKETIFYFTLQSVSDSFTADKGLSG